MAPHAGIDPDPCPVRGRRPSITRISSLRLSLLFVRSAGGGLQRMWRRIGVLNSRGRFPDEAPGAKAMEIFAALSVGLLILVSGVVSVRTFALWRRTRGLPELLLTLMLFSGTVLGYPAMIATTQVPASRMWPLHVLANALESFGITCLLLFTLKVFRPQVLWA